MTTSSVELHCGLPEGRLPIAAGAKRWLAAVLKYAVVGGLAFAIGFLAIVAMRSFGWAAGVLASVSGPMLIASVVGRLYPA
jgi:hypothetical protein